ncbi:hypothetical protein [Nonomuraea dietziae]|uniref:hypothetical protein n=1 Tax=Nonomuraea dietziae TaxID=65515 RepID=UPI0033E8D806
MAGTAGSSRSVTVLRRLTVVLAAVLLLVSGLAVWLSAQVRDEEAAAADRRAALAAASAHAVNLLSLNYQSADASIQKILATSTGTAFAEYSAGAPKLKETTIANKVVQTGAVKAAGVVSMGDGTAKVLVVADSHINWVGSGTPDQDRYFRWSMDLAKVKGVWLVSKAEQVL